MNVDVGYVRKVWLCPVCEQPKRGTNRAAVGRARLMHKACADAWAEVQRDTVSLS